MRWPRGMRQKMLLLGWLLAAFVGVEAAGQVTAPPSPVVAQRGDILNSALVQIYKSGISTAAEVGSVLAGQGGGEVRVGARAVPTSGRAGGDDTNCYAAGSGGGFALDAAVQTDRAAIEHVTMKVDYAPGTLAADSLPAGAILDSGRASSTFTLHRDSLASGSTWQERVAFHNGATRGGRPYVVKITASYVLAGDPSGELKVVLTELEIPPCGRGMDEGGDVRAAEGSYLDKIAAIICHPFEVGCKEQFPDVLRNLGPEEDVVTEDSSVPICQEGSEERGTPTVRATIRYRIAGDAGGELKTITAEYEAVECGQGEGDPPVFVEGDSATLNLSVQSRSGRCHNDGNGQILVGFNPQLGPGGEPIEVVPESLEVYYSTLEYCESCGLGSSRFAYPQGDPVHDRAGRTLRWQFPDGLTFVNFEYVEANPGAFPFRTVALNIRTNGQSDCRQEEAPRPGSSSDLTAQAPQICYPVPEANEPPGGDAEFVTLTAQYTAGGAANTLEAKLRVPPCDEHTQALSAGAENASDGVEIAVTSIPEGGGSSCVDFTSLLFSATISSDTQDLANVVMTLEGVPIRKFTSTLEDVPAGARGRDNRQEHREGRGVSTWRYPEIKADESRVGIIATAPRTGDRSDECEDFLPSLGIRFREAYPDIVIGECRVLGDSAIVGPELHDALNRDGDPASPLLREIYQSTQDFRGLVQSNGIDGITFWYEVRRNLRKIHMEHWQELVEFLELILEKEEEDYEGPETLEEAEEQLDSILEAYKEAAGGVLEAKVEEYEDIQEGRKERYTDEMVESASDRAQSTIESACRLPEGQGNDAGLRAALEGPVKFTYETMLEVRLEDFEAATETMAETPVATAVWEEEVKPALRAYYNQGDDQLVRDFLEIERQQSQEVFKEAFEDLFEWQAEDERYVNEVRIGRPDVLRRILRLGGGAQVQTWEGALDAPKTTATACYKTNVIDQQIDPVETTVCEQGDYQQFIIRGAPFPAKARGELDWNAARSLITPPTLTFLNEAALRSQTYAREELGIVCGGRPGDAWWAEDCSCNCGDIIAAGGSLAACPIDKITKHDIYVETALQCLNEPDDHLDPYNENPSPVVGP